MGCGIDNLQKMWFEAARQGDVIFLESHKNFVQSIDRRKSDPEFGVFCGFSAIHYAIVCEQFRALKYLLDLEYYCRLPQDVIIQAPSISQKSQFVLREGSSIYHISFLVGNARISQFILDYDHESGQSLVGVPDCLNVFSTSFLFLVETTESTIKLLHSNKIEEEILYESAKQPFSMPHIHTACKYCRYGMLEHLVQFTKSPMCTLSFKERCYQLSIQIYENKTCFDYIKDTSFIDAQRTRRAAEELTQQAIVYFKKKGAEDKAIMRFRNACARGSVMNTTQTTTANSKTIQESHIVKLSSVIQEKQKHHQNETENIVDEELLMKLKPWQISKLVNAKSKGLKDFSEHYEILDDQTIYYLPTVTKEENKCTKIIQIEDEIIKIISTVIDGSIVENNVE